MIYEEGGYEKEADSIGDFRSDSFMSVHIAGFPYASGKGRLCRRQYHVWFGCGKIPGYQVLSGASSKKAGEWISCSQLWASGEDDSGLWEFPYKEEPEYKKTLKEKGDVYIIMLGTNDSKVRNWNTEDYKEQLRVFVTSYQKVNKRAKIYLMQPPRCFPDEKTGIVNYKVKNDLIATEIHKSVAEVGLECGAIVIDLYEFTEDHGDWFADGVHPNVKGYEKIAGYIYEVLKETL